MFQISNQSGLLILQGGIRPVTLNFDAGGAHRAHDYGAGAGCEGDDHPHDYEVVVLGGGGVLC